MDYQTQYILDELIENARYIANQDSEYYEYAMDMEEYLLEMESFQDL